MYTYSQLLGKFTHEASELSGIVTVCVEVIGETEIDVMVELSTSSDSALQGI